MIFRLSAYLLAWEDGPPLSQVVLHQEYLLTGQHSTPSTSSKTCRILRQDKAQLLLDRKGIIQELHPSTHRYGYLKINPPRLQLSCFKSYNYHQERERGVWLFKNCTLCAELSVLNWFNYLFLQISQAISSRSANPCNRLSEEDGTDPSTVYPGRLSRDEMMVVEMKIPLTVRDIIETPMEEFNDLLSSKDITEEQINTCRDIRRRGKNKVRDSESCCCLSVQLFDPGTCNHPINFIFTDCSPELSQEEVWSSQLPGDRPEPGKDKEGEYSGWEGGAATEAAGDGWKDVRVGEGHPHQDGHGGHDDHSWQQYECAPGEKVSPYNFHNYNQDIKIYIKISKQNWKLQF